MDTNTCPVLGQLVPLFWISGGASSGFQSQSGFCLVRLCGGKCYVHSLKPTSGATLANLLTASQPHASAEMGVGSDANGQSNIWLRFYSMCSTVPSLRYSEWILHCDTFNISILITPGKKGSLIKSHRIETLSVNLETKLWISMNLIRWGKGIVSSLPALPK